MSRVVTKAGELMANADMLRRELEAEREISRLLAEALEKTTFAAAAVLRGIDKHVAADEFELIMRDVGMQYDGFGKEAREALAKYREGA